ncbi:MAG: thioredoxin family protein [Firmicutes bacterium]|nr:thioredoxin family protein [Bacillota bacterium]
MKVKIIGNDSGNRMRLLKNVARALEKSKENFEIELLEDQKYLDKYNITNTPGLVIKEKVVSQGKILNEREIKNYIRILT